MRKISLKRSETTIDNIINRKRKRIVENQISDFLKLFPDGWIKYQYVPEINQDIFITSPLKNYLDDFSKFAKWETRRWNKFSELLMSLKSHQASSFIGEWLKSALVSSPLVYSQVPCKVLKSYTDYFIYF